MSRSLLLLFTVFSLLTACTDGGPDQAEFNEAMQGVPVDPDSYELTVVRCQNDGEFIRYTWGIKNLSGERKTFAFDPVFTTLEGLEETNLRELVAESVGPGEYVEWSGGAGGGERFPIGDVECRFEVVDSVLGEYRGEG